MSKKTIYTSLGLLLLLNTWGFAQKKPIEYSGFFDSYYYRGPVNITVGTNAAGYIGTLGAMPGAKISPGFNVGVNYQVWPRMYFGGEFNYYKLGSVKKDTSGSISFNTTVYELIAYGRFNLIDNRIHFKNDIGKRPPRVRPYITAGIGAVYYSPTVAVSDTNFSKSYKTAKASNIAIVLPVSLGFAFYLSKRFSLLTEVGYRYALTDGLDGISKLNASGRDSYVTASVKLQYTFHPLKKRKGKYVPHPEGYGAPSSGRDSSGKAPKDSTLNEPILPPGQTAPTPADSSAKPASPSGATPPATPTELTDEQKKQQQYDKEQSEWEQSAQPKKATPTTPATPAATPPATPATTPADNKQNGGW